MAGEKILIIEDEKLIRFSLAERLKKEAFFPVEAEDGASGFQRLEEGDIDLVLLDYRLPDTDGLQVLQHIVQNYPEISVILITAFSTVAVAVEAMKLGAYDYLNKPFNMDEMVIDINKALETTKLKREVRRLRQTQEERFGLPKIIGESPAIKKVFDVLIKVAESEATTILIQGESGTGKDLLAKAIHFSSSRAEAPFINVTCSALPETLLESELFGYEKGAFTDAKGLKKGLFELADRGTVFLDEVGDMPFALQSKLLRFLEEKSFKRVGGAEDIRVDVRIIGATNQDLKTAVSQKRFRQDLFYRLNVIPIYLPPLRERKGDIPLLVKYYIEEYNREFKKAKKKVTDITGEAMDKLLAYHWPGNIRELKNVIERAMILGEESVLDVSDFPLDVGAKHSQDLKKRTELSLGPEGINFEELEKNLVSQALDLSKGNQTLAAKLLGMTRDQIRYRVEKFHLG